MRAVLSLRSFRACTQENSKHQLELAAQDGAGRATDRKCSVGCMLSSEAEFSKTPPLECLLLKPSSHAAHDGSGENRFVRVRQPKMISVAYICFFQTLLHVSRALDDNDHASAVAWCSVGRLSDFWDHTTPFQAELGKLNPSNP